ncbi:MAG: hypothetical protein ACI9R3_001037 [Verrucomicrobiales bacterium]|jgi:hypothetical protein
MFIHRESPSTFLPERGGGCEDEIEKFGEDVDFILMRWRESLTSNSRHFRN